MNMNQNSKKWLYLLPVIGAGATAAALVLLNRSVKAETSPDHQNEKLRTRFYEAEPEDVRAAVVEVIPNLRKYGQNWRLAGLHSSASEIEVKAEVPVFMFTDDLTVSMRGSEGGTLVDVHAKTRCRGKSDLGENRRHILQLFGVLDQKFQQ